MRNRRAFLSIVLTAATATAVYAEPTRFTSGATRSSATVTRELPSPAAQVAWMQVIALYPSAI
jgi:hypothetical protein